MLKSKRFRVATEGATTDGRKISRDWIKQMAANYDRAKYGARIWLEHIRGIFSDSPFSALGDVISLEAKEDEHGKLGLYAELAPSPELVQINQKGQKIFTSIEVDPNFADSGEAYLVGLAVTDSPASLGTEALAFCANRKQKTDNLFTSAIEAELKFIEQDDPAPSLFSRIQAMFSKKEQKADDHRQDQENAILELAKQTEALSAQLTAKDSAFSQLQQDHADLKAAHEELLSKFNELTTELDQTPSGDQRQQAAGGSGQQLTDC